MEALVLKKLYERVNKGEKAALVMITKNCGSVPGKEGAIMAVFPDGSSVGTVGGGAIEYDLIKRSVEGMENNESFDFDYSLTDSGELKMTCGGQSRGFVRVFFPRNNLIIFGAGHCSQKIAKFATICNFSVTVIDDREEFKDLEDFKDIDRYIVGTPDEAIDELYFDKDTTFIVMATRGHKHDIDAARVILNKDYKYAGMLGSRKKTLEVKKKLLNEGFSKEKINEMYLPIGLDLSDGTVEEIGIAVIAEMLKVKNGLSAKERRLKLED